MTFDSFPMHQTFTGQKFDLNKGSNCGFNLELIVYVQNIDQHSITCVKGIVH